jgi:signal transduction histidine kinase
LDPELLERVFFNLILNAVQASPPGALVTIRTRALPNCCEISVWDQGPGVPAALKERIFDPFFTTRPAGTGLGLAICARIVAEHGGRILVEGEPGQGAVFLVLLPWQVPDFPESGA